MTTHPKKVKQSVKGILSTPFNSFDSLNVSPSGRIQSSKIAKGKPRKQKQKQLRPHRDPL